MTDLCPVYVIGGPGAFRELFEGSVEGLSPRAYDAVDAFMEASEEPGVVYLLAPALDADAVLRAVEYMADAEGGWIPVLVRATGRDTVARTVSLGDPRSIADTVAAVTGRTQVPLLELGSVLRQLAQTRHDINNPLTSAMAEAQLLHMDATDPEEREALRTVLEQLRRIRDLIGATVHLRPLK